MCDREVTELTDELLVAAQTSDAVRKQVIGLLVIAERELAGVAASLRAAVDQLAGVDVYGFPPPPPTGESVWNAAD